MRENKYIKKTNTRQDFKKPFLLLKILSHNRCEFTYTLYIALSVVVLKVMMEIINSAMPLNFRITWHIYGIARTIHKSFLFHFLLTLFKKKLCV